MAGIIGWLLKGTPNRKFSTRSADESGVIIDGDGNGLAISDMDNDGDQDALFAVNNGRFRNTRE